MGGVTMMTLEDAIKHCEQKACGNDECSKKHKQLAEWLKELQALKANINYKEIEERAKEYALNAHDFDCGDCDTCSKCKDYRKFVDIVTEQKAIDIEKAKTAFNKTCGWLSTYPWYNEVFEEFIKNIEE